jgi:hypothetical protein
VGYFRCNGWGCKEAVYLVVNSLFVLARVLWA